VTSEMHHVFVRLHTPSIAVGRPVNAVINDGDVSYIIPCRCGELILYRQIDDDTLSDFNFR